jgi:hypothetical protein
MSHIVSVQTKLFDPAAINAACQRLNLPTAVQGTVKLFSGEATGLQVQLPGWQYPAVIDTSTGEVKYDNYNGAWGNSDHLTKFLQLYAVERAKIEARRKGYTVHEQALNDGSIKVQILTGDSP